MFVYVTDENKNDHKRYVCAVGLLTNTSTSLLVCLSKVMHRHVLPAGASDTV